MAPLTPGHISGVKPSPSRAASMGILWETWNRLRCCPWTRCLWCTTAMKSSGSPWPTRSGMLTVRSWRLFLTSCFGLHTHPAKIITHNILTGNITRGIHPIHRCYFDWKCSMNSSISGQTVRLMLLWILAPSVSAMTEWRINWTNIVVTPSLKYTVEFQEGSKRRIHVSLEDTAVTPTPYADLDRKVSSPVSALLASTGMAAHAMVRMTAWLRTNIICFQKVSSIFAITREFLTTDVLLLLSESKSFPVYLKLSFN